VDELIWFVDLITGLATTNPTYNSLMLQIEAKSATTFKQLIQRAEEKKVEKLKQQAKNLDSNANK